MADDLKFVYRLPVTVVRVVASRQTVKDSTRLKEGSTTDVEVATSTSYDVTVTTETRADLRHAPEIRIGSHELAQH